MYAIATLIMGGNNYVPAAIALAKSLQPYLTDRDIELVCLVTDDVSDRDDLYRNFHHVHVVDKISAGNMPSLGGLTAMKIYHWISDAPTKWNIFALDTYEKVLFLDADMIVLQDIYDLFSLDPPAAMFDHQAAREYATHPDWTGHKEKGIGFINWYKICLGFESKKDAAYKPMSTGERIPSQCIENLKLHSNSQFALHGGIALIKPDKSLLARYIESLPDIIDNLYKPHRRSHIEYVKTDRTLSSIDEVTLCIFMHNMGYQWTHIGMEYNVAAFHTYNIFKANTKILHYVGCYKPWSLNHHGVSEREYVASKSEQGTSIAYKSHHKVIELWWEMYEKPNNITISEVSQ